MVGKSLTFAETPVERRRSRKREAVDDVIAGKELKVRKKRMKRYPVTPPEEQVEVEDEGETQVVEENDLEVCLFSSFYTRCNAQFTLKHGGATLSQFHEYDASQLNVFATTRARRKRKCAFGR